MSADLIAAGDQHGCLAFTIAAASVTCGQDIDVQSVKYLTILASSLLTEAFATGDQAARI